MYRKLSIIALLLAAVAAVTAQPKKDQYGYYTTGYGIRVKNIAFINVNVYEVVHKMKEFPKVKSKPAVIEADVDKQIVLRMLRDVPSEKLVKAVGEAYALNGYTNGGAINQLFGIVQGDVKKDEFVVITYTAATKTVSMYFRGKGSAVGGVDFMKATWSCWFGKIDQPSLGDGLISQIP